MKKLLRYILLIIFVCLNAGLVAFALKVNVGVDAWAASSQSLAQLCHIQVGTMEMFLNCFCVFLQMLILRKEFRVVQLVQIPLSILIGYMINFVYYDILIFDFTNYYIRLSIIIIFYLLSAFVVAGILILDEVTYPLEGLCIVIQSKTNFSFSKIRQSVDIFCILMSICLSLIFHLPFSIREGALIGMFIFGPTIDFAMKKEKQWIHTLIIKTKRYKNT